MNHIRWFVALPWATLLVVGCQHVIQQQGAEGEADLAGSQLMVSYDSAMQAETFDMAYLMGQFDPAAHPHFETVDRQHADREGMYLRKDTYEAFRRMYEAALQEGIKLQIRSATRNFEYQKGIWERKWRDLAGARSAVRLTRQERLNIALEILLYSSMPGTSRHHWGTDIDLNSFSNSFFEQGVGKVLYDWLQVNGSAYGFCQPYTAKDESRAYGYEEERWHWTYTPVSAHLTQMAVDSLTDAAITGFEGSDLASEIEVVQRYVLGIATRCREVSR